MTADNPENKPVEKIEDLFEMLRQMQKELASIQNYCKTLEERVDRGEFDNTNNGMSLLENKYHLLLMYCSHLCLYIAARCKGESLANHEILNQLAVTVWILDKLRAIQKQCQYSIDKLLDHAKNGGSTLIPQKPNLLSLRPLDDNNQISSNLNNQNISEFLNDDGNNNKLLKNLEVDDNEANIQYLINKSNDGLYHPPKLNPLVMDDPKLSLTNKQKRQLNVQKKQVRNTEYYKLLKEDLTNLPKEEHFHLEQRKSVEENNILDFEEDRFRRTKANKEYYKKKIIKEKLKEKSAGENFNKFIDNMGSQLKSLDNLKKFHQGSKFDTTIGKEQDAKKYRSIKHKIKGPWKRIKMVKWLHTKQGQRVMARRKYRKSHPLPFNPAKLHNMKGLSKKKAKKIMGVRKSQTNKIKKLRKKI